MANEPVIYGGRQARRRIVSGDEQDAFTDWRTVYCYLHRPKVVKRIKRRANKRERQEGKAELRKDWE